MVIRNFKEDPISEQEVLECYWYAVVDDTIGGWAISNVNKTVADLNPYKGWFELGSFLTEYEAKHIADVHNAWWDEIVWGSYKENLEWSLGQAIRDYYSGIAPLPDGVKPITEDEWFDYSIEDEALDNSGL